MSDKYTKLHKVDKEQTGKLVPLVEGHRDTSRKYKAAELEDKLAK